MRQPDSEKFALLRRCERIWAIASIHGDVQRLTALHDKLSRRVHASDRVVYLGNYMGVGPAVRVGASRAAQAQRLCEASRARAQRVRGAKRVARA